MKRKRSTLLPSRPLLWALIFASALVPVDYLAARDLWVSPRGESCVADACLCRAAAPCLFSADVVAQLKPGRTMNFLPGSYPGIVMRRLNGTQDRKITIRGVSSISNEGSASAVVIRGDETERRDAVEFVDSSHLIFENFRVSHARRAGIRVNASHHIEVKNTVLVDNGIWGIFTNHANDFAAIGNTIIGPARQHGIYHSNSGDNVRIVGNYIVDFDGSGIHLNGDLSMGGAADVVADGIISNVDISDNFLAGNGRRGGSAVNLDGAEKVFISGNIVLGNKGAGIAVFKEDGGAGSSNVYAQRNLLVMAPESRSAIIFNSSGPDSHFSENMVVVQDSRRGIYDVSPVSIGIFPYSEIRGLSFTSDMNYFYVNGNFAFLNRKQTLGFSAWQRRGQDKRSKIFAWGEQVDLKSDFSIELPAALAFALNELDVAAQNPYRRLLGVATP